MWAMSSPLARMGLLWVVSFLLAIKNSSGQCSGQNKTTFLRSSGFTLDGSNGISIPGVGLNDCSELCELNTDDAGNRINCASYIYSQDSRQCVLSSTNAQPFGAGRLVTTSTSTSFYQKICISSQYLCDTPFSYERMPQHVLVGFALEVVQTDGLSECLSLCLQASQQLAIECRSAMYFYDSNECILNKEDRFNRADLFTNDTQGQIVDYFDNNCAGVQCFSPEIPQYIKTKDYILKNERDISFSNILVEDCEHFCSANQNGAGDQFPCKSYMYVKSTKTCYLSNEKAQPVGRGKLSLVLGTDYYEKVCLSAPQTCGGKPAMDRFPQMIIVGFAAEVTNAPTVNDCMNQCLAASGTAQFQCKSLMYYYESSECLLNTETRLTQPNLFTEENDRRVDYFDNICYDEPGLCAASQSSVLVKVNNASLPDSAVSAENGLSLQQCIQGCKDASNFVCRSFNYANNMCRLSYQNSLLSNLDRSPNPPQNFFEARCVADSSSCGSKLYAFTYLQEMSFFGYTGSTVTGISRDKCISVCLDRSQIANCLSVNYVKSTSTCHLNTENCRTKGSSTLRQQPDSEYYENNCVSAGTNCEYDLTLRGARHIALNELAQATVSSVDQCHQLCSSEKTFICKSVAYGTGSNNGICILSDVDSTKQSLSAITRNNNGYDYYERLTCSSGTVQPTTRPYGPITTPATRPATRPGTRPYLPSTTQPYRPNTNNPSTTRPYRPYTNSPTPTPTGYVGKLSITSTCNIKGTVVTARFPVLTTGSLFTRDHYETCRVDFTATRLIELQIPFPGNLDAKLCGGEQIRPHVFVYMVVLQENDLGVPGLMMQGDRVFNVTCNYKIKNQYFNAKTKATVKGPEPGPALRPPNTIHVSSAVQMRLLRDNRPVNAVMLGEKIELQWKIKESAEPGTDYFIKSCSAERVGGTSPHPGLLHLVNQGCPMKTGKRRIISGSINRIKDGYSAPFTVFRFDGSRSVKLRCMVEVCNQECKPVICQMNGQNQFSMGRKKRQVYNLTDGQPYAYPTVRQEPVSLRPLKHGTILVEGDISGIFTVVDRLPQKSTTDEGTSRGSGFGGRFNFRPTVQYPRAQGPHPSESILRRDGNICLVRSLFIGLFTFMALFCGAEGTVVACYLYLRFYKDPSDNRTGSPHSSGMESSGSESNAANNWTTGTYQKYSHWRQRFQKVFSSLDLQYRDISLFQSGNDRHKLYGRAMGHKGVHHYARHGPMNKPQSASEHGEVRGELGTPRSHGPQNLEQSSVGSSGSCYPSAGSMTCADQITSSSSEECYLHSISEPDRVLESTGPSRIGRHGSPIDGTEQKKVPKSLLIGSPVPSSLVAKSPQTKNISGAKQRVKSVRPKNSGGKKSPEAPRTGSTLSPPSSVHSAIPAVSTESSGQSSPSTIDGPVDCTPGPSYELVVAYDEQRDGARNATRSKKGRKRSQSHQKPQARSPTVSEEPTLDGGQPSTAPDVHHNVRFEHDNFLLRHVRPPSTSKGFPFEERSYSVSRGSPIKIGSEHPSSDGRPSRPNQPKSSGSIIGSRPRNALH